MSLWNEITARLAALSGTSTPQETRAQLNEFDVRDIQAVRVSQGGGGSLPAGWTAEGNPANVNTNGGTLTVETLTANNGVTVNNAQITSGGGLITTGGGDLHTEGGAIDTGGGALTATGVDAGGSAVTSVDDPTDATDAATKGYADTTVGGLVLAEQSDGVLTVASGGLGSPVKAAFVTNGSTVDQLRDALITAGFMDPSP